MNSTIHMNGFHTNEKQLLCAENLSEHYQTEVTIAEKRDALYSQHFTHFYLI